MNASLKISFAILGIVLLVSMGALRSLPSFDSAATPAARLAAGPIPPASGTMQVDRTTIYGGENFFDGYPARNDDGTVNVVVEIPAGTNAKWEVDKEGVLRWELRDGEPRIVRYLPYVGNYGMIPSTLLPKDQGGDGDALDVLILGPALARGRVVRVRVIGVFKCLDGGEQDDKLLAVMENAPLGEVATLAELDERFPGVSEIVKLWFTSYKGPGVMEFLGWGEVEEAEAILERAIKAKK